MTTFEHFDPFERRISAALDDIALAQRPNYLEDILYLTANTTQRPRWSFLSRWLPFDFPAVRRGNIGPLSPAVLALLVVAALVLAALVALSIGSALRVPPPFGEAANGQIAYEQNGAIYVRGGLSDSSRLLIGEESNATYPYFSPDGRHLFYASTINGLQFAMIAKADGSSARRVIEAPLFPDATVVWAPDSRAMAVINQVRGEPVFLSLVNVDGSLERTLNLGDIVPTEVSFRPPQGRDLLVRGQRKDGTIDLFIIGRDGTGLRQMGLPSQQLFGAQWDNGGAAWFLDGTRIAYNRVQHDDTVAGTEQFRVHALDPMSLSDIQLPGPSDPNVMEAWPTFSPNGEWILVHRWTWKSNNGGEGWLAVMPADGSVAAHDVGPRIKGGEDTGLLKLWSPDGRTILMRAENLKRLYSIDPLTGSYELLDWAANLPDWQRLAP